VSAHAPTHEETAPIGGSFWNGFTGSLAVLVALMVAVIGYRFAYGIGSVTNLNDGYPWGLWIAYDVVAGTALGAGGFTVALVTYIINRGEFHPIVRPALVAAFFGYLQAAISVFVDIGRPWNGWHLFIPKYAQINSVLFEVAVCIAAYLCVIAIELSPAVLERLGWKDARKSMNRVLFFFVGLGVVLPMMHQSSLGSLLVVLGPQVNPLYQTQLLPLLFLTSCIGMGLAAVTFEGTVSSLAFRRPLERELLGKLMGIGAILAGVFLVLRFGDVLVRGELGLAFAPTAVAATFWVENALFLAAILLVATEASRRRPQRLFLAAGSMATAGIVYRLSAYLVAYETGAGWRYFPSVGELVVTAGLIAFEILGITWALRRLPILPKVSREGLESRT
jgi:Ni/Fe-hydrogenase subunit HybB-like protein